jgi:hypothetical protein
LELTLALRACNNQPSERRFIGKLQLTIGTRDQNTHRGTRADNSFGSIGPCGHDPFGPSLEARVCSFPCVKLTILKKGMQTWSMHSDSLSDELDRSTRTIPRFPQSGIGTNRFDIGFQNLNSSVVILADEVQDSTRHRQVLSRVVP